MNDQNNKIKLIYHIFFIQIYFGNYLFLISNVRKLNLESLTYATEFNDRQ